MIIFYPIPQQIISFWSTIISSLINIIPTALLAVFAWIGLSTWRKKIRTDKCYQFLDDLINCVHEAIILMEPSIDIIEFAESLINDYDRLSKNIGEYFKDSSHEQGVELQQSSDKVISIISKIKSLAAKGQVFGFIKYDECSNACDKLEQSFKQIITWQTLLLSGKYLILENPEIKSFIEETRKIKPLSIEKDLENIKVAILQFAKINFIKLKLVKQIKNGDK